MSKTTYLSLKIDTDNKVLLGSELPTPLKKDQEDESFLKSFVPILEFKDLIKFNKLVSMKRTDEDSREIFVGDVDSLLEFVPNALNIVVNNTTTAIESLTFKPGKFLTVDKVKKDNFSAGKAVSEKVRSGCSSNKEHPMFKNMR